MKITEQEVKNFAAAHERALDVSRLMMVTVSERGFTVGDIALGALYILQYYSERHPDVLFTARKMMAISKQLQEQINAKESNEPDGRDSGN